MMKRTLFALLAVAAAMSIAPHASAQICHYWSWEACFDACERGVELGHMTPAEYGDCVNLCETSCGPDGGIDTQNPDGPGSPIVIDLGNGTLRFTSASDGVLFDLDGDGQREALAWTEPGSADGFLVLDRNGNGTVDSGLELFGNFTAQPASPKPNGFLALAVFDTAAQWGNGDGVISEQDRVFNDLRLWFDANHNGRSEPQELDTLETHGIVSIDLHYKSSRRRDPHGNELRYRSRVDRNGPPTVAVDVFFRGLQ